MSHLFMLLERFRKDEKGATAIEYGLIAALIAVAAIAAMTRSVTQLEAFSRIIGTGLRERRS